MLTLSSSSTSSTPALEWTDRISASDLSPKPSSPLKEVLGSGTFALVCRAVWTHSETKQKLPVALKIFKPQASTDAIQRELKIAAMVSHENIIRVYGSCVDPSETCIVMEYAEKGTLSSILHGVNSLAENWIMRLGWLEDTLCGLSYLHNHSPPIIHRDLKPENILIRSNLRACISDFGLSKLVEKEMVHTLNVGTPLYQAPEVRRDKKYTLSSDIWSFGMVMFELLTRLPPYSEYKNSEEAEAKLAAGTPPMIPDPKDNLSMQNCPLGYIELMKQCWEIDPTRRPNCESILRSLEEVHREMEKQKEGKKKSVTTFRELDSGLMSYFENFLRNNNLFHYQEIVLFIGISGVGKSTLVNYLLGSKMKLVRCPKSNKFKIELKEGSKEHAKIGNRIQSETLYPQLFPDEEFAYYDCPGFLDTRHEEQQRRASVATQFVIRTAPAVRAVVVCLDSRDLQDKGHAFSQLVKSLEILFKDWETASSSIIFVITKAERELEVKHVLNSVSDIQEATLENRQGIEESAREIAEQLKTVEEALKGEQGDQKDKVRLREKAYKDLTEAKQKKEKELEECLAKLSILDAFLKSKRILIFQPEEESGRDKLLALVRETKTLPKDCFQLPDRDEHTRKFIDYVNDVAQTGYELFDTLIQLSKKVTNIHSELDLKLKYLAKQLEDKHKGKLENARNTLKQLQIDVKEIERKRLELEDRILELQYRIDEITTKVDNQFWEHSLSKRIVVYGGMMFIVGLLGGLVGVVFGPPGVALGAAGAALVFSGFMQPEDISDEQKLVYNEDVPIQKVKFQIKNGLIEVADREHWVVADDEYTPTGECKSLVATFIPNSVFDATCTATISVREKDKPASIRLINTLIIQISEAKEEDKRLEENLVEKKRSLQQAEYDVARLEDTKIGAETMNEIEADKSITETKEDIAKLRQQLKDAITSLESSDARSPTFQAISKISEVFPFGSSTVDTFVSKYKEFKKSSWRWGFTSQ